MNFFTENPNQKNFFLLGGGGGGRGGARVSELFLQSVQFFFYLVGMSWRVWDGSVGVAGKSDYNKSKLKKKIFWRGDGGGWGGVSGFFLQLNQNSKKHFFLEWGGGGRLE